MVTRTEVAAGFTAAWHVFTGRPKPLAGLDMSADGFWRSFVAPFMALPLYVIHVMAEHRLLVGALPEGADVNEWLFLLTRAAAFLADIAAFPLLMAILAKPLGLAKVYVPLIVIFNWTAPLIAVPLSLPSILLGAGMMGPGGATVLILGALVLTMAWRFRAAKAALGGAPGLAAAMVAIDFLLSLVLGETITRFGGL